MRWRVAFGVIVAGLLGVSHRLAVASEGRDAGIKPSTRSVTKMEFGKIPEGRPVELYILSNGKLTAKVMTYGAIVTELHAPDRDGKTADVVLGFDDLNGYLAVHPYFGATVGRVANRIAGGRFTLDGQE